MQRISMNKNQHFSRSTYNKKHEFSFLVTVCKHLLKLLSGEVNILQNKQKKNKLKAFNMEMFLIWPKPKLQHKSVGDFQ